MECIVVSYCLSKTACLDQVKYRFHFKGFFAGKLLKEIRVIGKNEDFLIGSEYIIHLKIIKVIDNILMGRLLRKKLLEEITTDFL